MKPFLDEDSPSRRLANDSFDPLAQARTERLLRDAHNATLLSHRLALLNIEAQHRLAWYRSHFNPNQPRVPAGHPDGGQWTSTGDASTSGDTHVISDAAPENDRQPGAQYVSRRTGRPTEPEPSARLEAAMV